MKNYIFLFLLVLISQIGIYPQGSDSNEDNKIRVIVTTDGEVDDKCSMIRFLLYADMFDVEGLIYSSSMYHYEGSRWEGTNWIEDDIDRYSKVYDNLKQNDPNYPTPDALRSKIFVGNISFQGDMSEDSPGSDRIVNVLIDNNPAPVYLLAWGGTNTIARALWKIQHEFPDQIEKVNKKAVLYLIEDQDWSYGEYIQYKWPDLKVIINFIEFGAIAYHWNEIIPSEYHKYFDKEWTQTNIIKNKGVLMDGYPQDYFISEGDSPSFIYLIPNGLSDPQFPSYGGWGGRFGKNKLFDIDKPTELKVLDRLKNELPGITEVSIKEIYYAIKLEKKKYQWVEENLWTDDWDDGDVYKPIWRWTPAMQNDFAARAEWCVKPYNESNHHPEVVVNRVKGRSIIYLNVKSGATMTLDAVGSTDPDGNRLNYNWWNYKEAGTYDGTINMINSTDQKVQVQIPAEASGKQIHIILTVTDNGTIPLTSYRRVVFNIE